MRNPFRKRWVCIDRYLLTGEDYPQSRHHTRWGAECQAVLLYKISRNNAYFVMRVERLP